MQAQIVHFILIIKINTLNTLPKNLTQRQEHKKIMHPRAVTQTIEKIAQSYEQIYSLFYKMSIFETFKKWVNCL